MSYLSMSFARHLSATLLLFASYAFAQIPAQNPQGKDPKAEQSSPVAGATATDILIGSGDLVQVTVFGAPDFDRQVRVDANGEITLPMIGVVKIAGKRIPDAEKLIAQKLTNGGFFNDPSVQIFEKEYATQGVSVLGEVQKPGVYPLLGARTLYDVISAAGGVTAKAGNSVTITHRASKDKPETINLPADPSNLQQANVQVFPGDIVAVSKAGIVYVVGDVAKPGGFIIDNSSMTVLQAIAMAQGINQTAALDKARLIRKAPNGTDKPQDIPISLKQILSAKAPDLSLQPDDIVFVPNSAGKTAARRGLEAILQTATGIAIYRR
jgi:polysaccharide biosynthesis/export protein